MCGWLPTGVGGTIPGNEGGDLYELRGGAYLRDITVEGEDPCSQWRARGRARRGGSLSLPGARLARPDARPSTARHPRYYRGGGDGSRGREARGEPRGRTTGSGGLDRKTGAPGRWYQRCLGERRAARGQRQGCDDTREIRGTGRGCVCLLSLEQRAGDSETRRRGDGETEVTAVPWLVYSPSLPWSHRRMRALFSSVGGH